MIVRGRWLCVGLMFSLALVAVLCIAAPASAQNTQQHVYGAKTARPYTVDDYVYGHYCPVK